ncbi:hypothetical protein BDL97_19G022800 [Sphagnum fallax]|nr:hypothetical protein BDL97_19G022800 [Sphagnum fallax]
MNKAKSSEQHLDISHSSIFVNLNVGSSSNNMDIPDRTLSSIFFESDGGPDDEYRTYRGLVLDLSYRLAALYILQNRRRCGSTLLEGMSYFGTNSNAIGACRYCGAREDLTMDHVLAASRGGKWEWENLVTACSSCNVKKGDKTLEEAHMKLLKPPREPKELDSIDIPHGSLNTYRRLGQRRSPPPTQWLDYLPKRTSFF